MSARWPLFAALVLLMGVAPLTMWYRTSIQRLGRTVLWPTAVARQPSSSSHLSLAFAAAGAAGLFGWCRSPARADIWSSPRVSGRAQG